MKSICLVLLICLITSCSKTIEIDRDFKILFKVNGVERTVYDFESSYVTHLISTGKNDSRNERETFLTEMIDEILLAQSAIDKGFTSHLKYQAAIEYQQRKSMIDTYFVDMMEDKIEPLTDDEIRLAYAKKQRTVYIRQLYSKDQKDLELAYDSLNSGKNFIDVANTFYETEEYDSSAGYLGPISYFGVDDVVAEAAYSTNQGQFTKPIRSRLGYHIIYVDHITYPAILAEDEYLYRKQGIASQMRLRKQRLVSNDYIFDLMSGLDVQTDNTNLRLLREVIANIEDAELIRQPNKSESPELLWTDERVEQLSNLFDRNAILATYKTDQGIQVFTFGEYLSWLPYLSFQESKIRLGASVGRGMRNQVLYEMASFEDYHNDSSVKKKVEMRSYEILSDLYQYSITMDALLDTSQVEVPETFKSRLISSRNLLLKASYWKIPMSNFEKTKQLKEQIVSGTLPSSIQGFTEIINSTIDINEYDYDLVKKSNLKQPIIAYSDEQGWILLQVDEREIIEISSETNYDDLQKSFKVFDSIRKELDYLRSEANIEVDRNLFEEISKIWALS